MLTVCQYSVPNVLRLLAPILLVAFGLLAAPAAADPCVSSRALHVGGGGALYSTVAPFEHFGSNRTQVFPSACTTAELAGGGTVHVGARTAPVDFTTPYIATTRARNQLFVYGYGADAATAGGYVASVDPRSLRQRWRTQIPDPSPAGQWSYPGVMLAHGNGFLYAVYGNVLVKLDAATGDVLARRELPEDPNGTGAAYNGMIVLPDGRIATKKIERGPCADTTSALGGLRCAGTNAIPSELVIVDPDRLRILDTAELSETVLGRITWGRTDGRDFIYLAGADALTRYRYHDGHVALDRRWGPVTYRTGAQQPGTGPGLLGDWVVVQTNFLPSSEPLTVTAVSARDSHRVFRSRPFAALGKPQSWIVSKAALDADNATIVTHDTSAGAMAALRLDPRRGLSVRWRHDVTSLSFSALTGDARGREIVIPDQGPAGETVVWLDERTGAERARSPVVADVPAPGNIVTPGFDGRFYYVSARGTLWELRPR